jgi:hypothetical protein
MDKISCVPVPIIVAVPPNEAQYAIPRSTPMAYLKKFRDYNR